MIGMMFVKILIGVIVAGVAVLVLVALLAKGSRKRYGNVE
jgi:hypothetical protein